MIPPIAVARGAHAALLVVGLIVAVLDVLAGRFAGAVVASGLAIPLAMIAIGLERSRRSRGGWRALLAAADAATIVGLGGLVIRPGLDRFFGTPTLVLLALVALALVGLVALLGTSPSTETRIGRTDAHRVLLIALVVLWTAYLGLFIGTVSAQGGTDVVDMIGLAAGPVAIAVAILAAWWFGAVWLLGAFGLEGLVNAIPFVASAGGPNVYLYAALSLLSIVAAILGPREQLAAATRTDTSRAMTATTIWLGLGALLYIPTVLWGLFPLGVIVDCFDACPQPIPGADALVAVSAVSVLVVAATAFAYAAGAAAAPQMRPLLWASLAGALLVIVEIVLGLAGTAPFGFLPVAGPAAMLVAVGSAVGIARPWWIRWTSHRAAIVAAVLAVAWIGASSAGPGTSPVQAVGLAAAAIVVLSIAAESSRSGDPAATTTGDSSVDADSG